MRSTVSGRIHSTVTTLVPGAGIEPAWLAPRDFKSLVSTSFTTRAQAETALQVQESGGGGRNRTGVHGFAGRCMTTLPPRQSLKRKGKARVRPRAFPSVIWSGKRVSNSRPQPWQGCALPTELFPRFCEGPHYKPSVDPSSTRAYSRTDA